MFGGPAWTRVRDGQWYLHLFAAEQPDLNWDNREVRDDFLTTLRFWSDRGVDGFRVDVAHGLAKDLTEPLALVPAGRTGGRMAGARPAPTRSGTGTRCTTSTPNGGRSSTSTTRRARRVAEAWVHPSRRPRYASPAGLGQAFNFDLLRGRPGARPSSAGSSPRTSTDAAAARRVVDLGAVQPRRGPARHAATGCPREDPRDRTAPDGQALAAQRRHRRPQLDRDLGLRRARAATLLMLALPGSAYLYQGEELGLHEVGDMPDRAPAGPRVLPVRRRGEGPRRLPRAAAVDG